MTSLLEALEQRKRESQRAKVQELLEILQPRQKPYKGTKPFPSSPDHKVCGGCWQELPRSEFQDQASSKDGKRPNCPKCNSQAAIFSTKRRRARNELRAMIEAHTIDFEEFPRSLFQALGLET